MDAKNVFESDPYESNYPVYTIDGCTPLGRVVLTNEEVQSDRELTVYIRDHDRQLFILDASGCTCCTNIYDKIGPADIVLTPSPADLAEYLASEIGMEGYTPGREEAMRQALGRVHAALTRPRPTA